MTPEVFNRYLKDPSLLDSHSVDELWLLVKEYPYFQVARMLLARNLHNIGHEAYPLSLRLAAAYAGDRSKLKILIEGSPVLVKANTELTESSESHVDIQENTNKHEIPAERIIEAPVQHVESADVIIETPVMEPQEVVVTDFNFDKTQINVNDDVSEDAAVELLADSLIEDGITIPEETSVQETEVSKVLQNPLIDIIFSRLSEVQIVESDTSSIQHSTTDILDNKIENDQLSARNNLVDKFIREEPRISTPKREFYNPEDKARQSISLSEDIVSETLAKIYEQQGHYDMAVKIFEKLMLLIPEKSSYFASLINEINKKRK
jgi:hypothetical protein